MLCCVLVPEILWLQFSSIVTILETNGGALVPYPEQGSQGI